MTIFSKVRYVLFSLTLLALIFASLVYSINVAELLVMLFSLLFFVSNKKWTDYIAFSAFTFWLVILLTYLINSCSELSLYWCLYLSLINPGIAMIWLLLFSAIWIYLILSFVKRIDK